MNLLLDTHVLLWAAAQSERLSKRARQLLNDPGNVPMFSSASLWEIVVKQSLDRVDFKVDARQLRRGLLDNGYGELQITSAHALAVEDLPPLHRDPFDRMLLAQSRVEGIILLTTDTQILRYPGLVQRV